jgi:hypothetical protein
MELLSITRPCSVGPAALWRDDLLNPLVYSRNFHLRGPILYCRGSIRLAIVRELDVFIPWTWSLGYAISTAVVISIIICGSGYMGCNVAMLFFYVYLWPDYSKISVINLPRFVYI